MCHAKLPTGGSWHEYSGLIMGQDSWFRSLLTLLGIFFPAHSEISTLHEWNCIISECFLCFKRVGSGVFNLYLFVRSRVQRHRFFPGCSCGPVHQTKISFLVNAFLKFDICFEKVSKPFKQANTSQAGSQHARVLLTTAAVAHPYSLDKLDDWKKGYHRNLIGVLRVAL